MMIDLISGATVHELKTWPAPFQAVVDGVKLFEVRRDDRSFCVGDILYLREYLPSLSRYTGRDTYRRVTFILRDFAGVEPGYVVLGICDDNAKVTRILGIANVVRKWMIDHYGSGVNLAGHCIEASELIASILHSVGIEAETVEGWVHYDNTQYCECEYEPHTWVEAVVNGTSIYIDVTADQFNYGMDPDCQFDGVIVQIGLPHGVSLECK